MRSSNFGEGILGKLRTEVPKSSMKSSNSVGVFWMPQIPFTSEFDGERPNDLCTVEMP